MGARESANSVGAIILAAGTSSRLGRPKQLLDLAGKPVFLHVVELALRNHLHPVVLVAGSHFQTFSQYLASLPIELLDNPNFQSGMASSLRTGLNQIIQHRTQSVVVLLADQPLVPDLVIRELVATYQTLRREGCRIVRPVYEGIPGNPVLFDQVHFPELLNLTGDTGARSLLQGKRADMQQLYFTNSTWALDIDTEEDWLNVQRAYSEQISQKELETGIGAPTSVPTDFPDETK